MVPWGTSRLCSTTLEEHEDGRVWNATHCGLDLEIFLLGRIGPERQPKTFPEPQAQGAQIAECSQLIEAHEA
jgi:hypothetical protein